VPPCLNLLTKKAPYKGLGADSEEKHEPVSDIDTAAADSLKALDPEWPIREADMAGPAAGLTRSRMTQQRHLLPIFSAAQQGQLGAISDAA
jgi:hypothetical protein